MPHGAETKTRSTAGVHSAQAADNRRRQPKIMNGRLVKQIGWVQRQRQSMRKYEASRG
jgi:hypothetical protein